MISNAVLLSTLAACALAAPTASSKSCDQTSYATNIWQVPARYDPKNPKQLAWKDIKLSDSVIDTASEDGNLFSYYPATYNAGGSVYVLFSGAPKDIDGMGQDVRIAFRNGKGWSKPEIAFPAALLPNQTTVETSDYYCKHGIPQRALQALSIVYAGGDEGSAKYYAVAQSSDNVCPGSFQSAGRIARLLNTGGDPAYGTFKGDPCWIETNDYTGSHEWAETVYGTKYKMKVCEDKKAINAALAKPEDVPAQATSLFNTPIIAADGKHNVSYPTHAVLVGEDTDNPYYMRFWSDVSTKNKTGDMFVEYSTDTSGKTWFPANTDGSKIEETNIYSSGKSWYGSSDSSTQTRVFISNGGMSADGSQELLTVATSRGSNVTFLDIGTIRAGQANKTVPKGTRGPTNVPGFYWPSASFSGDELLVAYSENTASIHVATIKLTDLP